MERDASDPYLDGWEAVTAEAIRHIEEKYNSGSRSSLDSWPSSSTTPSISGFPSLSRRDRPKSDSCVEPTCLQFVLPSRRTASEKIGGRATVTFNPHCQPKETDANLESKLKDIRYIDDSAKSSLSASLTDYPCSPPLPPSKPFHLPEENKLDEETETAVASPTTESSKIGGTTDPSTDSVDIIHNQNKHDVDSQSVYSLYMEKDFRYYFQHPYARLFVSYFVIFCNFLIFAEDPVSHSHTESEIPIVGNVFSFVATKYPDEWGWCILKVALWLMAILIGLLCGKYFIHRVMLRRWFRLKMFRDEQGTWMIMYLTVILFLFLFSWIYNFFLLSAHPEPSRYVINGQMGITNANFMKVAACGTWLGDFVTAWMVTDMMLQDNLYSEWGRPFRQFWRSHGYLRIIIFWSGAVFITALVVALITSDYINWDYLNRDFVATTELSRAFLASFILVMDLLIVMQDWDFPHFVCDLDIKLPGMHVASFKFKLFQKYVSIPDVVFHISGKWFNYGIIVIVMILDLNMWKNQIFYQPEAYGQYTGPDHRVYTVATPSIIATGNETLWSYSVRSLPNPETNRSYTETDMLMNSRYLGYPMNVKGMAFVPSLLAFVMFGMLTYVYGRFPPKTDETAGGRLKKRKKSVPRSSWRRERSNKMQYIISRTKRDLKTKTASQLADLVVAWEEHTTTSIACEKPLWC